LELLAEGDFRGPFESALCCRIPTNFLAVISSIYARSAWKYRERAYRYCLLDSGHGVTNALGYLRSVGLEAVALSLFKDDELNSLLSLDGEEEFALVALVGGSSPHFTREELYLPPAFPKGSRVVKRPIYYPLIVEAHRQGALTSCNLSRSYPSSASSPLKAPSLGFGLTLVRRRSRREFTGGELPAGLFNLILRASFSCIPSDWGFPLTEVYVQVRAVESVEDGIYRLREGYLEPVALGDFSRELSYLCLSQGFVARANFNVIFTLDFERFPDCRSYRGALLEAGALGESLYLACESLSLGACGVGAFYDLELRDFLSLRESQFPLYVVSCGVL
jgi:SagB-type dehydrogenase family enzyme